MLVGANHVLQNFSYADAAAREADTSLLATDIGKVAIQLDDTSFYILAATTPVWSLIGEVDPVDTFLELTDTPSSYAGQASVLSRVNAAEDAIEFTGVTLTDPSTFTASTALNLISTGDMISLFSLTASINAQHGDGDMFSVIAVAGTTSKLMIGTDVFSIETDETTNDTVIDALDLLTISSTGNLTAKTDASMFLRSGTGNFSIHAIHGDGADSDFRIQSNSGASDHVRLRLTNPTSNTLYEIDTDSSPGATTFTSAGSQTVVVGGANPAGIEYAADYSADFTARSLTDKAYVDAQIGAGPVTGPGSSVDNRIVTFDGVTGALIQDASVITLTGNTFTSTADIDLLHPSGNSVMVLQTSGDFATFKIGETALQIFADTTDSAATMTGRGSLDIKTITNGGDITVTSDGALNLTADGDTTVSHPNNDSMRVVQSAGNFATFKLGTASVFQMFLNTGTEDMVIRSMGDLLIDAQTADMIISADILELMADAVGVNQAVPLSTLDVGGSLSLARLATAVSASTVDEVFIGVTDTSAERTITISTADIVAGRIFIIKDESGGAGTNNITVTTQAAEEIDNSTDDVFITADNGAIRLYAAGGNLFSW